MEVKNAASRLLYSQQKPDSAMTRQTRKQHRFKLGKAGKSETEHIDSAKTESQQGNSDRFQQQN